MPGWKTELIRRCDQTMKVLQSRLWTVAFEAILKNEIHRPFNE